MTELERLKAKIDALNDDNFDKIAIEIFNYQYKNNKIYKKFVDALGRNIEQIEKAEQIPFMPISFFKTQRIHLNALINPEVIFESSGTSSTVNSKHYVFDKQFSIFYKTITFNNTGFTSSNTFDFGTG